MLGADNRLRKKKDFDAVYSRGHGVTGPVFSVRFKRNGLPHSRFAFIVSNKTEKTAPKRNRTKRQMRAVIRDNLQNIVPGCDVAITARRRAIGSDYAELSSELMKMLKRARLST